MTKTRHRFGVFSFYIVPKINKKGGFIDMNQKIPLLRNMFTQICVMFQKFHGYLEGLILKGRLFQKQLF